MVGCEGIEPSTNGLKVHCSTAELTTHTVALSTSCHIRCCELTGCYFTKIIHQRKHFFQKFEDFLTIGFYKPFSDTILPARQLQILPDRAVAPAIGAANTR